MASKRKLSISALAKKHHLTVPKMKNILVNAGVLDANTLLPFQHVVDSGRAEIKTTEKNRFSNSGPVSFAIYVPDIADAFVSAQSEEEKLSFCTSKYQAEDRLNELITSIGEAFGIYEQPDKREQNFIGKGASANNSLALEFTEADRNIFDQCYFGDPHFCGGPGWAIHEKSKESLRSCVNLFLEETAHIREVAAKNEATAVYVNAIAKVCAWVHK